FPNSGIRDKRRNRDGAGCGWLQEAASCAQGPLQGGDRPPARGRPAAARPAARGSHPQWQHLRGHERLPAACLQGAAASDQPATRPQGVAPRPGLPPARAVAGRSGRQQRQRQRKAARPAQEVPPEGSSACRRGGCPRRRRAAPPLAKGSGDDDGGWGQGEG
ncbi:hypothetical protein BHE74_00044559, partial [Ensete ventricosum]